MTGRSFFLRGASYWAIETGAKQQQQLTWTMTGRPFFLRGASYWARETGAKQQQQLTWTMTGRPFFLRGASYWAREAGAKQQQQLTWNMTGRRTHYHWIPTNNQYIDRNWKTHFSNQMKIHQLAFLNTELETFAKYGTIIIIIVI